MNREREARERYICERGREGEGVRIEMRDERLATSNEQRVMSDEQRATSDER